LFGIVIYVFLSNLCLILKSHIDNTDTIRKPTRSPSDIPKIQKDGRNLPLKNGAERKSGNSHPEIIEATVMKMARTFSLILLSSLKIRKETDAREVTRQMVEMIARIE